MLPIYLVRTEGNDFELEVSKIPNHTRERFEATPRFRSAHLSHPDGHHVLSPTATAFGSSAIVKVSGQNCFRTLSGLLGQIRLGLLKGSAEGCTEVPPRVHQGCASFVISLVFWGRSVLGCSKVPRKVAQRFHQGFTKVAQVS